MLVRICYSADKTISLIFNARDRIRFKRIFFRLYIYLPNSRSILCEIEDEIGLDSGSSKRSIGEREIDEWKWPIIHEAAGFSCSGKDLDIPWIIEYSFKPNRGIRVYEISTISNKLGFVDLVCHFMWRFRRSGLKL